jgi:hypothetical protein
MEVTPHLERLAERLASCGLTAVFVGGASDELRVGNPSAPGLAETIRCAADNDSRLCFIWSWGPAIAPVDDLEFALERIAHVLKAVDS